MSVSNFPPPYNPPAHQGRITVTSPHCTMRLLTHNMLESPVKGIAVRFPLVIESEEVEVRDRRWTPLVQCPTNRLAAPHSSTPPQRTTAGLERLVVL